MRQAGLRRVALECFGVASLDPETGEIPREPEPGEAAPPPDGEIRELERSPGDVMFSELVNALSAFLKRNPHRRLERPSWLAVALWADELVRSRPAPADVEAALSWLEAAA